MQHGWKYWIVGGVLVAFLIINNLRPSPSSLQSSSAHTNWFAGSVNSAFATAKKEDKFMLLFWGAVWCPPCNELKSQVFSHRDFPALISNVIPVYLDGDSTNAQYWGDKLKVNGYPTVLLLDSSGQELWRLSTSLSFSEFKTALLAAFAAKQPIGKIIEKGIKNTATPQEWVVLANTSWVQIEDPAVKKDLTATLKTLKDHATDEVVKASLSAAYLEQILNGDGKGATMADYETSIQTILGSESNILATRGFLFWYAKEFFERVKPLAPSTWIGQTAERWLDAMEFLRNSNLSPEVNVNSYYPAVELAKIGLYSDPNLKGDIASLPGALAQQSPSDFTKKATVSTIAYMLRETGQVEAARKYLLDEIKSSDTPWYLYSSLASLEEKQGHKTEAISYAHMAAKSAQGNATSIQWLGSELQMRLKLQTPRELQKDFPDLLQKYYGMLFQSTDGFSGRNLAHADNLARKISANPDLKKYVGKTIEGLADRCEGFATELQSGCKTHFKLY